MNTSFNRCLVVVALAATSAISSAQVVVSDTVRFTVSYEKALARFTPAEIQNSFILSDSQEAAQSAIRRVEQDQQKMFSDLSPAEQKKILDSVDNIQVEIK